MNLTDLVQRPPVPEPWAEGDKIPWDDPDFSERMLREHLSQEHDAASRRASVIDAHVAWIHATVLGGQPGRVLDLGCGPGLYTSRLAALGHECAGIDFAPAAIAYARDRAAEAGSRCEYHQADIRAARYGSGYDLVMLLFGEFNVFHPDDARLILTRARQALRPAGQILLEAHTIEAVRAMGEAPRGWRSATRGLFSPRPHLWLHESFWHDDQQVATTRNYIIDAATHDVAAHAESVQAYTTDAYRALLTSSGFAPTRLGGALDGSEDGGDFVVLLGTVA